MAETSKELAQLRAEIDHVDDELVRLLDQRAALSLEVARVKRHSGEPVRDEGRERRILERLLGRDPTGVQFDAAAVRAVFDAIFDESRRMQHEQHARDPE